MRYFSIDRAKGCIGLESLGDRIAIIDVIDPAIRHEYVSVDAIMDWASKLHRFELEDGSQSCGYIGRIDAESLAMPDKD